MRSLLSLLAGLVLTLILSSPCLANGVYIPEQAIEAMPQVPAQRAIIPPRAQIAGLSACQRASVAGVAGGDGR